MKFIIGVLTVNGGIKRNIVYYMQGLPDLNSERASKILLDVSKASLTKIKNSLDSLMDDKTWLQLEGCIYEILRIYN